MLAARKPTPLALDGRRRAGRRALDSARMPEPAAQRLPAVPAGDRRAAHRERAAAHLRGPLPADDRALPASGEGSEFGIVWLSDEELKPVGCACEIEQVLERMDDGRLNILARGTRPFRLLERQDDLPYPAGVVEFLDEQRGGARRRGRARRRASSTRELVEQATDQRARARTSCAELDAYRDGRARSSSAPTPSRSCSSCARRTRACACSRCCSAPRSSAWSWSSARRRARARTARSASAERSARSVRATRQVADLLGDLQHEQRELAQHLRAGRRSCRRSARVPSSSRT